MRLKSRSRHGGFALSAQAAGRRLAFANRRDVLRGRRQAEDGHIAVEGLTTIEVTPGLS